MLVKTGNIITIGDSKSEFIESLAPGNWQLKYNDMIGYYLDSASEFKMPEKTYGTELGHSEMFLKTYEARGRNTGVLLEGFKGSGKSLLAKKICIDSGLPVIIISEPHLGDNMISFLNSITQPCIIFFDEFEKVYSEDKWQRALLPLFDGGNSDGSNKLFIATVNYFESIIPEFINRPGRFYFRISYDGLQEDIIEAVIDDLLEDSSKKETILNLCNIIAKISFDLLISMIEFVNLHDMSVEEIMNILNIAPQDNRFSVSVNIDYKYKVGEKAPDSDLFSFSNDGVETATGVHKKIVDEHPYELFGEYEDCFFKDFILPENQYPIGSDYKSFKFPDEEKAYLDYQKDCIYMRNRETHEEIAKFTPIRIPKSRF